MNLKNYINSRILADTTGIDEAISSGRMRSKGAAAMPESLQLKDIMSWLENIGVQMLRSPSKFKVNYLFTNNGQNFVVLFPETKQHGEICFIFKISPSGFTYPMRMEEEGELPTHYNGGDRAQNEMFFYKIYSLATTGSINEAVSSGKHRRGHDPKFGVSVEELVEWIRELGVTNGRHFNASMIYPSPGGVMYEIGPCQNGQPDTFWVQVIGTTRRNYHQILTIFTKKRECDISIEESIYKGETIDFDDAIDYARQIIEDPNTLIDI